MILSLVLKGDKLSYKNGENMQLALGMIFQKKMI